MTIEEIRLTAQAQYRMALDQHDAIAAFINAAAVSHCYHEEGEWEQKYFWRGRARGALDIAEKVSLIEKDIQRNEAYAKNEQWNNELARISKNAKDLRDENERLQRELAHAKGIANGRCYKDED